MKFVAILQDLADEIFYQNKFWFYPFGFLLVVLGGSCFFVFNYLKSFFNSLF